MTERIAGSGAAEATIALTTLLKREGHSVRLFAAESMNVPPGTDYQLLGEWQEIYDLVGAINDGHQPARQRDNEAVEYHSSRRQFHKNLIKELRAFGPDVVHFHNVSAVLSHVSALAVSQEWPLVWTLHGRHPFDLFHNEWTFGSEIVRSWEKTVAFETPALSRDLLAASGVSVDFVAPSQWLRRLGEASPLGEKHRFHLIRNAVSDVAPASTLSGDQIRRTLGVDRLLLAVVPKPNYSLKGLEIAVSAFFRARALLTHKESTRETKLGLLVTTEKDLGLSTWGVFALPDLESRGLILDNRYLSQAVMRDLYLSVDAVVIASRAENLPNVAVEAIRDRCPVIATDVGGLPELFKNAAIGRLVQSESIVEMADAMVEVTGRGRDSYKDALSELWDSTFAPERIAIEMEALFMEAIARHHSSELLSSVQHGIQR